MNNYFTLDLVSFNQDKSKNIFTSIINFSDLNKTARMRSRRDDSTLYQRELGVSRIKNIVSYIKDMVTDESNRLPIFPTPLVLAVNTDQEFSIFLNEKHKGDRELIVQDFEIGIEKYMKVRNKIAHAESLSDDEKLTYENIPQPILIENKLYVPFFEKNMFIVDGQHRYKALETYCKEYNNKVLEKEFQFLTTILLDYDVYQQSRIFASINFNQKPVNKSLYYDIFGSIYESRDEITFSHFLVKNFNDGDGFSGIVKLLGTGSGIISLAFFVETIMYNLITKNGCLYSLYKDYENDKSDNYVDIPNFLINYFTFIKINFEKYFPKKKDDNSFSSYGYNYYLFKTTGMYGLLLLLNDIIDNDEIILYEQDKLFELLDRKFKKIKENPEKYFNNDEFLRTAGKGTQVKFYQLLKENLI